ncbi:odorant receptor 131-2-like [Pholidichthys leucotaenia]
MLSGLRAQSNHTSGLQQRTFLEVMLTSALISTFCCVFLFINCIMIVTLRSKPVFRESSCYILLFNLLITDTLQMTLSQILFYLSIGWVRLTYPVCGFLKEIGVLFTSISPLTLMLMSVERYVAVCHPLRHTAISTIRNTRLAILGVWAFGLLNALIESLLLLEFPFSDLTTLLMSDFCSNVSMALTQMAVHYKKAFTCFLFVSVCVVIISSYFHVVVTARSASANKASAQKARNTLLLHLIQLSLCLTAIVFNPLITEISKVCDRDTTMRIWAVSYVLMLLVPRCLSPLIYGLRHKTIRTQLVYHICGQLTVSVDVKLKHQRP